MNKSEIERKFLLGDKLPDLSGVRRLSIRQGYLIVGSAREVRLRGQNQDRFLTVKDGRGLVRGEVETSLSKAQFDLLWPLTAGKRIEKTRYLLPWKGLTIEMDLYEGDLAPLRVAEIEFGSRAESEQFISPAFFGEEITGLVEYTNARLASCGLPSPAGRQIGCVPFLFKGKDLQIVLVRSSSGQRWIVPKGQNESGMSQAEVALMEAAEEAGTIGVIADVRPASCVISDGRELSLYALRVATLLKKWPEDSLRKRIVLPWAEAVASIEDKALAACVEELAKRLMTEN